MAVLGRVTIAKNKLTYHSPQVKRGKEKTGFILKNIKESLRRINGGTPGVIKVTSLTRAARIGAPIGNFGLKLGQPPSFHTSF